MHRSNEGHWTRYFPEPARSLRNDKSDTVREALPQPSQNPSGQWLHPKNLPIGWLGNLRSLFQPCNINGVPFCAQIDSSSTISTVRAGLRPRTEGPAVLGWRTATTQLGCCKLQLELGCKLVSHKFWLALALNPMTALFQAPVTQEVTAEVIKTLY